MKNSFISRIIPIVLLFFLFIRTNNLISKLMLIVFISCILFEFLHKYFLSKGKENLSYIFKKLYFGVFLLSTTGFLLYWSYITFINHEYFNLSLTIPFWIVILYIFISKILEIPIHIKINFPMVISTLLVGISLISGLVILYLGISDTIRNVQMSKDYVTMNASFCDYEIYNQDEDGISYRLIYCYEKDNIEYQIKSDMGVSNLPEIGSLREIKVNPKYPSKAVFPSGNSSTYEIFIGLFFTLVSLVFVLFFLNMKGIFKTFKFDVMTTFVGFVFLIIGVGILWIQSELSFSFIKAIQTMKLWIIIPILFILVGSYIMYKQLKKEQ